MSGNLWEEAREALRQIANHALQPHSQSVDIRFLNSTLQARGIKGAHQIMEIFGRVSPSGGTPTAAVLKEALDEQIDRLDELIGLSEYSSEPPLDIIVITDGIPDSPPAPVIEAAAQRMRESGHHPKLIGIQFVQIGNSPQAELLLQALISGDNNDMVRIVSYSASKDKGGGRLTADVLERIIWVVVVRVCVGNITNRSGQRGQGMYG